MRTASTRAPSRNSKRYLRKPSAARSRAAMCGGSAVGAISTRSTRSRLTPRTDRRSRSPRCTAAASSLRPISSVTSDPRRATASSGSIPARWRTRAASLARVALVEVDECLEAVDSGVAKGVRESRGRADGRHEHQVDVAVWLVEAGGGRQGDAHDLGRIRYESPAATVPDVERRKDRAERENAEPEVRRQIEPGKIHRGFDDQPRRRLLAESPYLHRRRCSHHSGNEEPSVVAGIRIRTGSEEREFLPRCGRERGGRIKCELPPLGCGGQHREIELPSIPQCIPRRVGAAVDCQPAVVSEGETSVYA